MAHYFEVNGIREKIFILQSLAFSGENFSKEYGLGCRIEHSLYSQKDYWLWIKSLVSNSILEISVKIRNASEAMEAAEIDIEKGTDIYCVENREVTQHDFMWLSNKIIHARRFEVTAVGSHKNEEPLEWWDGDIRVYGEFKGGKNKWDISFNTVCWLKSCLFFLNKVEPELDRIRSESFDLQRCI